MPAELTPVATVTGLYRGTAAGLEPLTKDTPLTQDEVRRNPVFYELELAEETEDADLIVDISYDTMAPVRLPDLFRGTDIPRGIRFWPDWFEIPPWPGMRDVTGRRVYPRAPGVHTVRIRTAQRLRSQQVRERDFSPANRGYTSPLFEFAICRESSECRMSSDMRQEKNALAFLDSRQVKNPDGFFDAAESRGSSDLRGEKNASAFFEGAYDA